MDKQPHEVPITGDSVVWSGMTNADRADVAAIEAMSRDRRDAYIAAALHGDVEKRRRNGQLLGWVFIAGAYAALVVTLWPLDSMRFSLAFLIVVAMATVYREM